MRPCARWRRTCGNPCECEEICWKLTPSENQWKLGACLVCTHICTAFHKKHTKPECSLVICSWQDWSPQCLLCIKKDIQICWQQKTCIAHNWEDSKLHVISVVGLSPGWELIDPFNIHMLTTLHKVMISHDGHLLWGQPLTSLCWGHNRQDVKNCCCKIPALLFMFWDGKMSSRIPCVMTAFFIVVLWLKPELSQEITKTRWKAPDNHHNLDLILSAFVAEQTCDFYSVQLLVCFTLQSD